MHALAHTGVEMVEMVSQWLREDQRQAIADLVAQGEFTVAFRPYNWN